jgi:hypothetical protein
MKKAEQRMGDLNCVLKVYGVLAKDMRLLNEKVKNLLQWNTKNNAIMLDLTFDRVAELGKLESSCLESTLVYPCVQYVQLQARLIPLLICMCISFAQNLCRKGSRR